jgi:preprotein translocase subunit SecD
MWKKLLMLVVAIGIIGGGRFLYLNRYRLFRPNFDRTGGTLLVYQVEGQPSTESLDEAIRVLQRRFDARGETGIIVRANEDGEIEIAIPRGARHDDSVEAIKRMITIPGRLEIRIIAHKGEDDEGMRAATDALVGPDARKIPPPAPPIVKPKGALSSATAYRFHWARLSENEVYALRLDDASLHRDNLMDLRAVQSSIKTGEAFSPTHAIFSLIVARLVRGEKDPVFFIPTRQEPVEGTIISEHVVRTTLVDRPKGGHPFLSIRLDREGSNRLWALTTQNWTSTHDPVRKKRLAVILDDEVLVAPVILAPSRLEIQVVTTRTRTDSKDLVKLIRGGALSIRLKPEPIREVTVEGRKGLSR